MTNKTFKDNFVDGVISFLQPIFSIWKVIKKFLKKIF